MTTTVSNHIHQSGRNSSDGAAPQNSTGNSGTKARYDAPRGSVHPDSNLGWIRRLWPVVAGHRGIFAIALIASIVSLLCGVAVPRIMMAAIDQALDEKSQP